MNLVLTPKCKRYQVSVFVRIITKGMKFFMIYANPNTEGSVIQFKEKYDNFIGGKWVAPVKGEYFDVTTPVTGEIFTKAARSSVEDIELALDAAHAAKDAWGKHLQQSVLEF